MRKLNNKGYMLIEIIVASVLAIGIGYYLIELTFNFSNKNDDTYQSVYMLSDKTVITKSIMNDLEGKVVTNIVLDDDINDGVVGIEFNADDNDDNTDDFRKLTINQDTKEIKYGLYKNGNFDTNDESYYYKKLSNSVIVGDISVFKESSIVNIIIPMSTIYDDTGYEIKLSVVSTPIAVMMASDTSVAFWQSAYSDNITSINFKSEIDVPSTAVVVDGGNNYWDISADDSEGQVIAYIEDDGSGNGTYKLTIGGEGGIYASSGQNLFFGMGNVTNINFNNSFDVSKVENMSLMFFHCRSLTSLDVSTFDTSNVTNMYAMFAECYSLSELILNDEFDTSSVTDMKMMFYSCNNLTLDCSSWNVNNVTNHSDFKLSAYGVIAPIWVN